MQAQKKVDGYKFSFKKSEQSAQQTPKFTSIQFQPNSLAQKKQGMNIVQDQSKSRTKNSSKQIITQSNSKKKMRKLHILQSPKSIYFHAEKTISPHVNLKQLDLQRSKQNQVRLNRSIRNSPRNKFQFPHRQKTQPEKMETSMQFTPTFRLKDDQSEKSKLIKKRSSTRQLQKQQSYLQIYKKQRQQRKKAQSHSRQLIKQFNRIKSKKQLSLSNLLSRPSEPQPQPATPQSHSHSLAQTPRKLKLQQIQTNFFHQQKQLQLLDTVSFPQTERSKKFISQAEQAKLTSFFKHEHEGKNTGKNINMSMKGMFKSQRTNLNLRLTNIGTGISKLNIRID